MERSGYEGLRERAAWIDLSARGKIRVTGEDRARLLHAMSTNDVQHLGGGDGLYAFFLSAQGRILADAYVYQLGESLLLDTEAEIGDKLREHLDKYIIADDVELADETARWAVFGIEGPEFLEAAVNLGISVPQKKYGVMEWGAGFVVQVASTGAAGIRVFVSAEQKAGYVEKLAGLQIPQATAEDARVVRIENGVPRYGEEISERYLVQETQRLEAVHSNKGCYLGQEIVERVRSRGQVHRLLTPIRVKTEVGPEAGTKLMANGNAVAEIVSAAYSPALGEVVGLAYVRAEALQTKPDMVVAGSEPEVSARIA